MERQYRSQAALTRKRVQSLSPRKQAELKKRRMVKECGFVTLPASKTCGKITRYKNTLLKTHSTCSRLITNIVFSVLGAPGSLPFAPGVPSVLPPSRPPPWMRPRTPPPAALSSGIPDESTPSATGSREGPIARLLMTCKYYPDEIILILM